MDILEVCRLRMEIQGGRDTLFLVASFEGEDAEGEYFFSYSVTDSLGEIGAGGFEIQPRNHMVIRVTPGVRVWIELQTKETVEGRDKPLFSHLEAWGTVELEEGRPRLVWDEYPDL